MRILGLDEYEAAELALHDWVRKHHDEAQKKLDLYAEKGITIIEPQTVNIAVFQKAEILVAKEELRRLLDNLDRCNPEYRTEIQVELARALKRIHPIYVKTKRFRPATATDKRRRKTVIGVHIPAPAPLDPHTLKLA